jgi:hypothetical protein
VTSGAPGATAVCTSPITGSSSYSTSIASIAAAAIAGVSAATAATCSPWKPDLVDRDDRPVLDRVPVVGVDVGEVGSGQHADDARDLLRGRGVDRDDAPVRDRAAQDLAVQHPRHDQVADEVRLPARLLARVAARHRAADLRAGLRDGRRHVAARSATASTMPR